MYDVRGLRKNGSFLPNTIWEGEELAKNPLLNKVKKYFAQNNISVYYINNSDCQEIGLGKLQPILQSGSSDHLSPVSRLSSR